MTQKEFYLLAVLVQGDDRLRVELSEDYRFVRFVSYYTDCPGEYVFWLDVSGLVGLQNALDQAMKKITFQAPD